MRSTFRLLASCVISSLPLSSTRSNRSIMFSTVRRYPQICLHMQVHMARQKVTQVHMARRKVTQVHMARRKVTQVHMARQKVTQVHIARRKVTQVHMARQKVTQVHIARQKVTQVHMARRKVTQVHMARQKVTTNELKCFHRMGKKHQKLWEVLIVQHYEREVSSI